MKSIFWSCLQCPFFTENVTIVRRLEARFVSIFYKRVNSLIIEHQEKKWFMEEINSNTIYGFLRRTKQNLTSQSAFISTRTRRLLCRACLPWERLSVHGRI